MPGPAEMERLVTRTAAALTRAREEAGVSARAFARLLKKGYGAPHESTYYDWESGTTPAPAWALVAAAELSKLTVQDLLGERPDRVMVARLGAVEERLDQIAAKVDLLVAQRLPSPTTDA